MKIRAVGIVRPDETKVAHIHLKTEGWVEKLSVAFTGQKLKAGDPDARSTARLSTRRSGNS